MKLLGIVLAVIFGTMLPQAQAADQFCQDICRAGELNIRKMQSWGCGHDGCKFSGCRVVQIVKGACQTNVGEFVASGVGPSNAPNATNLAIDNMWFKARAQCGSTEPIQISETEIFDVGTFISVRATFRCH